MSGKKFWKVVVRHAYKFITAISNLPKHDVIQGQHFLSKTLFFRGLIRLIKTYVLILRFKRRNATVPMMFKETVKKYPHKIMFYHEDQKWTFTEIDQLSNQIANFFLEAGYHPGEEIALLMDSKPEYVAIWLGLSKAGLVTALINTNQRQNTLVHSITVVNAKAVIFGKELSEGKIFKTKFFGLFFNIIDTL